MLNTHYLNSLNLNKDLRLASTTSSTNNNRNKLQCSELITKGSNELVTA